MNKQEIRKIAETASSETSVIDFKEKVDLRNQGDIIEIIKDMIAMANSGGGCLLLGVKDNSELGNQDDINLIDTAVLADKIKKYTNMEFSKFEYINIKRDGLVVKGILVESTKCPIVFENPGTYELENKKQKTVFGRGTLYFRHGSKSETANNYDINLSLEREIDLRREQWLGNIRKVVEAPADHIVYTLPPKVTPSISPDATKIKITNSEDAAEYRIVSPDQDYPLRYNDVYKEVNKILSSQKKINQYDVQAITHVYDIDINRPDFFYQSQYGPKQFNHVFVDWIVSEYMKDQSFFDNCREKYRILKNSKRKGI